MMNGLDVFFGSLRVLLPVELTGVIMAVLIVFELTHLSLYSD